MLVHENCDQTSLHINFNVRMIKSPEYPGSCVDWSMEL